MDTRILLHPAGLGDVRHVMTGTDHDIPVLHVGPIEVTFYDHVLEPGQMSAWLADLSAHALELAAEIDAKWSPAYCRCGHPGCSDGAA